MKYLIFFILTCPIFVFSQKTTKTNLEAKPSVTFCNENGNKTLNSIPSCDSLQVNNDFFKITSFTVSKEIKGKMISIETNNNKLSRMAKNLIKKSEKGTVYFASIKAINTISNNEISLPPLTINWNTN